MNLVGAFWFSQAQFQVPTVRIRSHWFYMFCICMNDPKTYFSTYGHGQTRSDMSYLYSSRAFSASCLPPVQSSGLVSRYQVACLPLYQSARTALVTTHSAVLLLLFSAKNGPCGSTVVPVVSGWTGPTGLGEDSWH